MSGNYAAWEFRCQKCGGPRGAAASWCKTCHAEIVDELHNRPLPPHVQPPEDGYFCLLHVGFLCLEETPEQLEILRRREWPYRPREPGPARSGVTESNQVIAPIDRVAKRVTGWKPQTE